LVLLILYTAFVVPYKIAFIDDDSITTAILDYIVDILFAVDLFVNFITMYEDSERGVSVRNPKKIAVNYLKSWFIMDLLACLPIDIILMLARASADAND
jgi:hypothetical protein